MTARNGQQSTLKLFANESDQKKTRQNSLQARFMGKTAARDHLLCGEGSVFLMTYLRTPFHEETDLLSVLRFPFRVRTPASARARLQGRARSEVEPGLRGTEAPAESNP